MTHLTKLTYAMAALFTASFSVAVIGAQSKAPEEIKLPTPKAGQYQHKSPTLADIENDKDLHPELRKVILKGRDLFMNTQQLRGEFVFNDMNCKSCHMGEGRMASSPCMASRDNIARFSWQKRAR